MADRSYNDKLLKGKELLEYTKKLKLYLEQQRAASFAAAQEYTDSQFNLVMNSLNAEIEAREAADRDLGAALETGIANVNTAITNLIGGASEEGNTLGKLEQRINDTVTSKIELKVCTRGEYAPDGYLYRLYAMNDDNQEVQVEPSKNYLYMVPAPTEDDTTNNDPSTHVDQHNMMNEYVWNNDHYELVGSTDIRLEKLDTDDINTIWDEAMGTQATPHIIDDNSSASEEPLP